MNCCDGPVRLDDDEDDDCEICDQCLARQRAETDRFEPEDDPQIEPAFPESEALPIEHAKPNPTVVGIVTNALFVTLRRAQQQTGFREIDLLTALESVWRGYVQDIVIDRAEVNSDSAFHNRTAVVHALHTLIDDVLDLKIPTPKAN